MGYMMPVSEFKKRHRGTEMIGDTLFIDGTPHVECAKCGLPVKLVDSKKIVVGKWPQTEDRLEIDEATNVATVVAQPVVKKPYAGVPQTYDNGRRLPILRSVHGCDNCYDIQQREMLDAKRMPKPSIVFFPMKDCEGKRNGLTPGKLPNQHKKTWSVGTKSQKGFNTTETR